MVSAAFNNFPGRKGSPSFPDSRPITRPGRRTGFPSNTNRPPAGGYSGAASRAGRAARLFRNPWVLAGGALAAAGLLEWLNSRADVPVGTPEGSGWRLPGLRVKTINPDANPFWSMPENGNGLGPVWRWQGKSFFYPASGPTDPYWHWYGVWVNPWNGNPGRCNWGYSATWKEGVHSGQPTIPGFRPVPRLPQVEPEPRSPGQPDTYVPFDLPPLFRPDPLPRTHPDVTPGPGVPGPGEWVQPTPRKDPDPGTLPKRKPGPRTLPVDDFSLTVTGRQISVRRHPENARPPSGVREVKVRLGSKAVAIGRVIANAGGEVVEWIDILAKAAGCKPSRWKKGTYFQQKIECLFFNGGINNVDMNELFEAMLYNTVEDFAYGAMGKGSGGAAFELGQSTGFETGLAL